VPVNFNKLHETSYSHQKSIENLKKSCIVWGRQIIKHKTAIYHDSVGSGSLQQPLFNSFQKTERPSYLKTAFKILSKLRANSSADLLPVMTSFMA